MLPHRCGIGVLIIQSITLLVNQSYPLPPLETEQIQDELGYLSDALSSNLYYKFIRLFLKEK